MEDLVETLGWLGLVALLAAFTLSSLGRWSATSRASNLLNLIGAIGISIQAFAHGAYPPFTLNVFWAIVAVISLLRHRPSTSRERDGDGVDGAERA
ncbi:MAG: hypothetical protein R3F34_17500 [Planctomycetota bacterium]